MNWLAIPNGFWIALAYTGGVLAFVAGMLVVRAVRGRPVGWQPICRRCKHDLRGVDPSKGTCPECGADLTRSGAVRTGGRVRRAGAAVMALVAVALAGGTLWWLTPSRISRIRTDLIASMPVDTLVDAALSGVSSEAERDLAFRALDSLLGTRGGFPQQGMTRAVPSGALLDALLKLIARSTEQGRTPAAALAEGSMTKSLLQSLDDAEQARLIDLAVEEIIASDGKRLDLARFAVASTAWTSANEPVITEIGDRLRATEAGRAVLQPRIVAEKEATTGRLIVLDLKGPLDQLRRNNMAGIRDRPEALLLERAEVVKPAADAAPAVLRVVTDRGSPSFSRGVDMPALIADLPPGVHELRIKGIVAPQNLVPTRRLFSGATTAEISLEDAAKLEGARAIDQTLPVTIVAAQPPEPPLERVADAETIAKFTTWLRACRIESASSGKGIDFTSLVSDAGPGQEDLGYRFGLKVSQGGQTQDIGLLAGSGRGGRSMSGGRLPRAIVATEPFEIILDPTMASGAGGAEGRSDARALVWVRFTLRFANANARPEVRSEPLADIPAVATPLGRDQAREVLSQSIAGIKAPSTARRRSRSMVEGFTVDFGAATTQPVDAEGNDSQPLLLTGMFELRSEGALLAPVERTFAMLEEQGASIGFAATEGAGDIYPRTLRYTPNPAFGLAGVPTSFRYIAEPFELRFTDAAKPPEIVWLED